MTWKGSRLWVTALVVGVLVLGFGSLAASAQTTSQVQPASAQEEQDPSYIGSIAVPEAQEASEAQEANEAEEASKVDEANEADEATALASQAKITSDQAKEAAQAEVPGTVTKVELDNENGYLVYSVEVGGKDVKVDAGTGKVLHIEADDDAGEQQGEEPQSIED